MDEFSLKKRNLLIIRINLFDSTDLCWNYRKREKSTDDFIQLKNSNIRDTLFAMHSSLRNLEIQLLKSCIKLTIK